jgi:hypothetical protein
LLTKPAHDASINQAGLQMAYVLVRLVVLTVLWSLTVALMAVLGPITPMACYLAAVCWALIGILYLVYVRRLRLEGSSALAFRASTVFDSDNLS